MGNGQEVEKYHFKGLKFQEKVHGNVKKKKKKRELQKSYC